MPNITETISLLDELRGKATQGRWEDKNRGTVFPIDKQKDDWMIFETYPQSPETEEEERRAINNAEYIVALHNNLPALRQAALDGERYRKSGEALLKALENTSIGPDEFMATIPITEIEEGKIAKIIETYRQAVEQKEVPVSTLKVPYCNKCYPDHDHTRQETVEQKEV